MPKRFVSYGKCFLCEGTFAKNVITRHLKTCPARQETIAQEAQAGAGKPVRLFHLQAEGRYLPEYWLHFEMPANTLLEDLDQFLRDIWLECCDHLSAFIIRGVSYELDTGMVDAMWKELFGPSRPTRSMDVKMSSVLQVGEQFGHEYDFGTTTELKLKVVAEREGTQPKGNVRILARNYAPDYRCVKCRQPAQYLYVYESPYQLYCEQHAGRLDGSLLPLVNSPRTGECGYTGPERKEFRFEERMPASETGSPLP